MSAPVGKSRPHHRTAEQDAALWRRFRGSLGEDAKPSASQWLKVITTPAPEYDWQDLVHPGPLDPLRGEALLRGIWRAGPERYDYDGEVIPWQIEGASLHFQDRMHRFDWLPHLAGEGAEGARKALGLVDAWVETHGQFDGFSWRVGPTADRIWNWIRCGKLLFTEDSENSDDDAKPRMQALRRQVMHLDALVDASPDVEARFRLAVILTVLGALSGEQDRLKTGLRRLDGECTAQILPDGGHVSRSPERLLRAMFDLLAVRDVLRRRGETEPEFLGKWLPRMGAMLNFHRGADGGLLPFNDSAEAWPTEVDAALAGLDAPPRNFTFSPKSGFQKLQRGHRWRRKFSQTRKSQDFGQALPMLWGMNFEVCAKIWESFFWVG